MREQGRKLIQMMSAAIALLDQPESLLPVLARLGARHAGYGVVAGDYRTVGIVLLDTLAQALGTRFDAATREAWASMYALCSTTMQEAARVEHARRAA
jgi:methyl-accepting chemotaxis protein